MSSRSPLVALTLKEFMRRQQVLLLYRKILQAIREVPNENDRKYLQNWAREEFKRNKSATEEVRTDKSLNWWQQPPLSLLSSFFSLKNATEEVRTNKNLTWWQQRPLSLLSSVFSFKGCNQNDDYPRKPTTEGIGENVELSKSITS
ncbi:LYR motif-containing protein 2 isoform X1 [Gracilinanus agilis]|uniref:LYR motif-containing protein 2 isoform X1 n=1 Tax=Gracilinanus agilis TaxID=191870 RepID=UPI001CFE3313|nr:LYR motif-containing protein 2 isoform X1 [Gracilinanus agilis]